MNIFYNTYQENDIKKRNKQQWKTYGLKSFKNMLYFLGYPPTKSLHFIDEYIEYVPYKTNTTILEIGSNFSNFIYIIHGEVEISTTSLNTSELKPFALIDGGNIATIFCDFFIEAASTAQIKACSTVHCLSISKQHFDTAVSNMDQEELKAVLDKSNYFLLNYIAWYAECLKLSKSDRVKELYKLYPNIFYLFDDIKIAALLGMRRETFNRIKKDFFKNACIGV